MSQSNTVYLSGHIYVATVIPAVRHQISFPLIFHHGVSDVSACFIFPCLFNGQKTERWIIWIVCCKTFLKKSKVSVNWIWVSGFCLGPDSGLRKERRRRRKITNIISFDDDLDGGAEDEEDGDEEAKARSRRGAPAQSSVEEGIDPLEPPLSGSPAQNGVLEPGDVGWVGSPRPSRTGPPAGPPLPDSQSAENDEEEDDEEEETRKPRTEIQDRLASDQWV